MVIVLTAHYTDFLGVLLNKKHIIISAMHWTMWRKTGKWPVLMLCVCVCGGWGGGVK